MEVLLWDTLHAPDMGLMVILVDASLMLGILLVFKGNTCRIKNKSRMIISDIPAGPNGLYKVDHAYIAMEELEQVDMLTPPQATWPYLTKLDPDTYRSGTVTRLQLDDRTFICGVHCANT